MGEALDSQAHPSLPRWTLAAIVALIILCVGEAWALHESSRALALLSDAAAASPGVCTQVMANARAQGELLARFEQQTHAAIDALRLCSDRLDRAEGRSALKP